VSLHQAQEHEGAVEDGGIFGPRLDERLQDLPGVREVHVARMVTGPRSPESPSAVGQ
jgi:hypothetical protein